MNMNRREILLGSAAASTLTLRTTAASQPGLPGPNGMTMQRHFVVLEDGTQLHYRRAGSGPPVVLLHSSPQSGAASEPMALRLAAHFTAICLDTPGYGLSDGLPGLPERPALTDYLEPLRKFLDAIGIERVALYGNATGAEIAQLFAHAHPERVALCMLDTAGHKEDAALDAALVGYFPDVTPRRDGSHLLTHWDMVRSLYLFSLWHQDQAANRLRGDVPPPRGAPSNRARLPARRRTLRRSLSAGLLYRQARADQPDPGPRDPDALGGQARSLGSRRAHRARLARELHRAQGGPERRGTPCGQ
jgi:pimeloyl-ACP methyl ester carboxylesterase